MTTTLTIEETRAILGISKRTVYTRLKQGKLQSIRVGMSQRVTRESIEALSIRKAKHAN